MLKNTTKAVTLERVKLDFFVAESIRSTDLTPYETAEFEHRGVVIASRPLLSETDENVGASVLDEPVYVSFLAGANTEGDIEGVLLAHVPTSILTEDEDEPWRANLPSYLGELEDDEGVPLYPLGLLSRPRNERKYPNNFYEESRSMLRELLNVPVTDEAECAVEELLDTLKAGWHSGML